MLGRILLPRKHSALANRIQYIQKVLKAAPKELKESVLSPERSTASEIIYLEHLKRELKFNKKLKRFLLMWVILSLVGIKPKYNYGI